jgi:hypothetical protein
MGYILSNRDNLSYFPSILLNLQGKKALAPVVNILGSFHPLRFHVAVKQIFVPRAPASVTYHILCQR